MHNSQYESFLKTKTSSPSTKIKVGEKRHASSSIFENISKKPKVVIKDKVLV